MPNWCSNTLSINGPQEAIDRFHADRKAALKGKDCDFDQVITFHQVLPLPKELLNTTKTFSLMTEEQIRATAVANNWSDETLQDHLKHALTPEMTADSLNVMPYEKSNRLIQKYGHDNWYDWCIANWDTKWDAVRSHIDEDGSNIHFETAWSPPTKVIRELASAYPELTFIHSYSLEGEYGDWEFTYFTEDNTLMVSWEYTAMSGEAIPADEVDEHAIP